MLPGLSPRSASRTGSNPRPLERALTFANSFPNAIGEEEADEPALEALRSAGDDSPALAEARAVSELEIGLSTLMCWKDGVGACIEPAAKYAHRETPAAAAAEAERRGKGRVVSFRARRAVITDGTAR